MKLGVATSRAKKKYGPIAEAIQMTGVVDILSLEDQSNWHEYDYIIIFYNKVPGVINRPKKGIAWWMNDLRKPIEIASLPAYNFDRIFICHRTYDKDYEQFYKKPIHYIPQCGHSMALLQGRDINWEVVFIGKDKGNKYYHRDREDILREVAKHAKLKIISGEGQTQDQCWIYNQTKINLAMSFPMIEGTSNRLYNILASGGFCLTRYYPGLEKQFENKKHLVWYKDTQEAIELINHYLEHEEERVQIAKEGRKQYLKKHTAYQRLVNMFAIMQGKETKFRGYL